jgi:hypothetical protein
MVCFVDDDIVCEGFSVSEEVYLLNHTEKTPTNPEVSPPPPALFDSRAAESIRSCSRLARQPTAHWHSVRKS